MSFAQAYQSINPYAAKSPVTFHSSRHSTVEEATKRQAQAEIGTSPLPMEHDRMIKAKYGVFDTELNAYERNAVRREEQVLARKTVRSVRPGATPYERAA
jgi:hypothetical protein